MELALDTRLQIAGGVIAQVVEAELVAGAVGHVRLIRLLARHRPPVHQPLISQMAGGVDVVIIVQTGELGDNQPDAHAESVEYLPHPAPITPGQIVVDRHEMHALPRQSVEIEGQRGHERLALARLHLDDVAPVKDHTADQLHVVMAYTDGALGRLTHCRESLNQHIIERFATLQALEELFRLGPQPGRVQRLKGRLKRVDALNRLLQPADLAFVKTAGTLLE